MAPAPHTALKTKLGIHDIGTPYITKSAGWLPTHLMGYRIAEQMRSWRHWKQGDPAALDAKWTD